MWRLFIACLLALANPTDASAHTSPGDNAEMTAIFEADQEIRRNLTPDKFDDQDFLRRMMEEDAARRARTQELLAAGALATANDYYHAAFVFQPGGDADSYLLAHTLAVAAMAHGHQKAPWMAAATLDRYLQEIGRPQIYGTQYSRPEGEGWSMEPYDRDLIPDALRTALGVPDRAAQEEALAERRARDGGN